MSGYVTYDTNTKLLGLVGYPLGHSISAAVNNAMYRLGHINAVYLPFEVPDKPGNLERFLDAVKLLGILGFTATMPYKTRLLEYLDEAPEVCRLYNCVNNVKYVDGKFYGQALDGFGMCQAIEDRGVSLQGRQALILGAGGISGVVAHEMARRGVTDFTILNRTVAKAERIGQILADNTGLPVRAAPLTKEELDRAAPLAQVVAQCTSVGLGGQGHFPDLGFVRLLPPETVVADAIYNPAETELLRAAREQGLVALNGMGMLASQMTAITEFFFGIDLGTPGKEEAKAAAARAMAAKAEE